MAVLSLLAPLTGRVVSLDDVPDPVFAGRLLGDGAAIDPSGDVVVAPVAGVVAVLFPTGHALALRTDEGQEVLIHLGVDSSRAQGVFHPAVTVGQRVEPGEPMIHLDPAALRQEARSAFSPVLLLNHDAGLRVQVVAEGHVEAGRDLLIQVSEEGSDNAAS